MTIPENSINLETLKAITDQAAAQTAGVTGGSDPKLWLQALELITLDWLAPLRSELGLPDTVVSQPGVLDALKQIQTDPDASEPSIVAGLYDHLPDSEIAQGVEIWIHRHFLNPLHRSALESWWTLLYTFAHRSTPDPIAPSFLQQAQLQIREHLHPEREAALESTLAQIAPPPTPEHQELGLTLNERALVVQEILNHEWALAALRAITTDLEEQEIQHLLIWAQTAAASLGVPTDPLTETEIKALIHG